jgi:tetratricopeptide (TPR) repeat protein
MSQANLLTRWLCVALLGYSGVCAGAPETQDDSIGDYLRTNQMDQLLEVHLEDQLGRAESETERAQIAAALSDMYLRQLRSVKRDDPYRDVVVIRARELVDRIQTTPLFELKLELLVDAFVTHENAIELHQLRLLDAESRAEVLEAFRSTLLGLEQMLAQVVPELNQLSRRRSSARTSESQREIESELELYRRLSSFGHYYLGWSEYGIAVLEDRHVGDDAFKAFGWLLGNEGVMPQSKDLHLAAVEYEHVARSAIGVAMCYAQSDAYQFATAWLGVLLNQDEISEEVRDAAMLRQLRVHVMSNAWYDALMRAIEIRSDQQDAPLSVADARFVIVKTLESPRSAGDTDAEKLVQSCIMDLVKQREIGHIVELYQRFEHLPLLGNGFIPNYAKALAELERIESSSSQPNYMAIADLLVRSLQAQDVNAYPEHRDDCRLKLAYTYIRADKPRQAIEVCERVLSTSLDPKAIEEARWLQIAALDRQMALDPKVPADLLEQSVSSFIAAYPASERTRTLVLRYATRGMVDEQTALDTLGAIPEGDPNLLAARRLQIQLRFKMLRRSGFTDPQMLRQAREQIEWIVRQEQDTDASSAQERVSTLQIGIDLALRDVPPDPRTARRYIEQARQIVANDHQLGTVEAELVTQLMRAALIESRIEEALSLLDELRTLSPERARDGQVIILNAVVTQWERQQDEDSARDLIEIAVPVLGRMTPKAPEPIGLQQSALIEVVAGSALFLHAQNPDPAMRDLAFRLSNQVLERGQPSERGLRQSAKLAEEVGDAETLLESWLRLLAAYPPDTDRWYEARYESLRVMNRIDPTRARETYNQFKVLNPSLGPPPWNTRISALFDDQAGSGSDGGSP